MRSDGNFSIPQGEGIYIFFNIYTHTYTPGYLHNRLSEIQLYNMFQNLRSAFLLPNWYLSSIRMEEAEPLLWEKEVDSQSSEKSHLDDVER
jgi:hypothetical protein